MRWTGCNGNVNSKSLDGRVQRWACGGASECNANIGWPVLVIRGAKKASCFSRNIMSIVATISEGGNGLKDVACGVSNCIAQFGLVVGFARGKVISKGIHWLVAVWAMSFVRTAQGERQSELALPKNCEDFVVQSIVFY